MHYQVDFPFGCIFYGVRQQVVQYCRDNISIKVELGFLGLYLNMEFDLFVSVQFLVTQTYFCD